MHYAQKEGRKKSNFFRLSSCPQCRLLVTHKEKRGRRTNKQKKKIQRDPVSLLKFHLFFLSCVNTKIYESRFLLFLFCLLFYFLTFFLHLFFASNMGVGMSIYLYIVGDGSEEEGKRK